MQLKPYPKKYIKIIHQKNSSYYSIALPIIMLLKSKHNSLKHKYQFDCNTEVIKSLIIRQSMNRKYQANSKTLGLKLWSLKHLRYQVLFYLFLLMVFLEDGVFIEGIGIVTFDLLEFLYFVIIYKSTSEIIYFYEVIFNRLFF